MRIQSLVIFLGSLAVSNFAAADANARRLGNHHRRPPPPGPPGNGKWVWVPYSPHGSSHHGSSDWDDDGWDDDGHTTSWDGDAHDVAKPTDPEPPIIVVPTPKPEPPKPEPPKPEPPKPEPPKPEPKPEPPKPEPPKPEPPKLEPPAKEEPEKEEVEDPDPGYSNTIIGSIQGTQNDLVEGNPASPVPVGAIVGVIAAVAVVAAAAALFAKKRRSQREDEIDPEENDMLDEDQFVGDGPADDFDVDIPPPPPMEATNDDIELDESFLRLEESSQEDDISLGSDGLQSV